MHGFALVLTSHPIAATLLANPDCRLAAAWRDCLRGKHRSGMEAR